MSRTDSTRARRLPAEWEPQDGVLLTWPHAHSDWGPTLARVEPVFVEIARAVAARERLLVCARDSTHRTHIAALLADAGLPAARLRIEIVPSNDTWARDHGPITVIEADGPRLLDFVFNGWGGKFEATLDDRIPERLCARGLFGDRARERIDFVLEGGGIETDGEGTLLTTAPCQLHPGRNRGWTRSRIEAELRARLGVARVLWLEHGHLEGDDTDSHIDTLVRLCDRRTIVYVHCDDPRDRHFAGLAAMAQELRGWRDASGEPYTLVPLPWPAAKHAADGRRLPASYANFLVINGAVLVPTYRDAADLTALARIAGCFPEREVVGIDCLPLIEQGGSLHCLTMQFPAGTLAAW